MRFELWITLILVSVGVVAMALSAARAKLSTRQIDRLQTMFEDELEVLRMQVHTLQSQLEIRDQRQLERVPGPNGNDHPCISDIKKYLPYSSVHERVLSDSDIRRLQEFASTLGLVLSKTNIEYMSGRIQSAEILTRGRIAASQMEMCCRLIVARALARKGAEILEIGSMFGTAIGLVYLHMSTIANAKLTMIDLFDGYYGQSSDPISGERVSSDIVRGNLIRLGVDLDMVTLLAGNSRDPALFSEIANTRYDLIIVDGDHTLEGVTHDVETYSRLLTDDGIMLIDDDRNQYWPDVEKFVDSLCSQNGDLRVVARVFGTALVCREKSQRWGQIWWPS